MNSAGLVRSAGDGSTYVVVQLKDLRDSARITVAQYGAQAALLADVLQTEASLADSNNQYQQALVAFWTARADFERALGEETAQ